MHSCSYSRRLILLLTLLLLIPNAACADNSLKKISVPVNSAQRTVYLHFPRGREKEANLPVVLAYHGGGGNVDAMVRTSQLIPKSDSAGFIVAFPEGDRPMRFIDNFETWNVGRCCGSAVEKNVDDVGFASALMDYLISNYQVDRKRIFATGISNGAQMSYRIACELSGRIAAIAPVASIGITEQCNPTRAVPILHIHGTADACALYNGGTCGGCYQRFMQSFGLKIKESPWSCKSVADHIEKWRQVQHCSNKQNVIFNHGAAKCVSTDCESGSEVALCTLTGAGHTWPGGKSPTKSCESNPAGRMCKNYEEIAGPISMDMNANDIIWDFFSRHPLP